MGELVPLDKLQEACAVAAAYDIDNAAEVTRDMLAAQQHRGQDSSGIAVARDDGEMRWHTGPGLVKHVYVNGWAAPMAGRYAVGHDRYGTSGNRTPGAHMQPTKDNAGRLAFAQNGNLPTTLYSREFLLAHGEDEAALERLNDSEMMSRHIGWYAARGAALDEAVARAYPDFIGAFSAVALSDKRELVAFRDEFGVRPLSIGRLANGFVVASETCALDAVSADFVRDVAPGELVSFGPDGLRSRELALPNPKFDLFELVYFSSPLSRFRGRAINDIRREMGRNLAREHPANVDIVVPVPHSAIPAATGYAEALGLPCLPGLVRNPDYQQRTFIEPTPEARAAAVRRKLHADPEIVAGKRVALVDDSMVRGTTMVPIVDMLLSAGATAVDLRLSSPPIRHPDFSGIDMPDPEELIANRMTLREICRYLHVRSIGHLSLAGTIAATGEPHGHFSAPYFNGEYPFAVGYRSPLYRHGAALVTAANG
ncbi:MAG TPA: amidophosphoribosyltransferase [Candidatus Saccharimonadales bacterium]|nr:amidophosphoribosyltransferase [Candidatus Saccharimonadales bacterium]